jgi:hypothetical protein
MASYWHLRPFLWNHFDSSNALGLVQQRLQNSGVKWPDIPVLEVVRHELVPTGHGALLERRFAEAVEKIVDELILGIALVEEQAFPLRRRLFQAETPLATP